MPTLERIIATASQIGADTPAYRELLRITRLLLSSKDQDALKASIPDLERLEDEAHRDAQRG